MGDSRNKQTLLQRFDIPIEHLDYKYIDDCNNVKYLEKILRILKSGEEGIYPHLQKHCETKLRQLYPESKALRETVPILNQSQLPSEERQNIDKALETWEAEMKKDEISLESNKKEDIINKPPVRTPKTIEIEKPIKKQPEIKKNVNKIKSYEYDKWDKFNVDEELEKVDEEKAKKKLKTEESYETDIKCEALSDVQKKNLAEKEKIKGNEAYQAGQYAEAILYYSKSIKIQINCAAINNRAQAYIKTKEFKKALEDCEQVLQMEPNNVKAYIRRGTAYFELEYYTKSESDFEDVLKLEPNNPQAQKMLKQVREKLALDKPVGKGKKLSIKEISKEDFNKISKQIPEPRITITKPPEFLRELEPIKTTRKTSKKIAIEEVERDEEMEVLFEDETMQVDKEESVETAALEENMDVTPEVAQKLENEMITDQADFVPDSSNTEDSPRVSADVENFQVSTPFEFYRVWHTEKVGSRPQLAARLLGQVQPQGLPDLLSNKLDGLMMAQIISALDALADSGNPELALQLLESLQNAQRLTIVLLFLSPDESTALNNLVRQLAPLASPQLLNSLNTTFQVSSSSH